MGIAKIDALNKFVCTFGCGRGFRSKPARKRHNAACPKNTDREQNRAKSRAGKGSDDGYRMDPDLFSDIYDDLPDGAFFAMAEEHGLQPEDFIE